MSPDLTRRDALRLLGAGFLGLLAPGGAAGAGPEPALLRRVVPSSGESLPVIGLGTWRTFDVGGGEDERTPLRDVLARFVARGGRVIDSSPMYGRSESVVGDLAAQLGIRDRLFVATKVWTTGKAAGLAQLANSRRELRTATLDLLQVHNLVDAATQLATLREEQRAGRVRHVGITHYVASAYGEVERLLRKEKLDFLQINFSPLEREAEERLLPLARERGVAVLANRPFGGGALFDRVKGRAVPGWARELGMASWAQMALRWTLGHEAVTCAIPATSQVRHLEDNLAAGMGAMPDAATRRRLLDAIRAL